MCIKEGTLQAYLDGELGPSDRESLAAHISACGRCRIRADAAAARHARVGTLLRSDASDLDRESTMAALARFREVAAATRHDNEVGVEPSWALRFVAVLAVATALVVIAVGLLVSGRQTPPQPAGRVPITAQTVTRQVPPASPERPAPVARVAPVADAHSRAAIAKVHRQPAALRRADSSPYFLLTSDTTLPEVGMIVRITLPLSMVATEPLMLPADAANSLVEADVLVGQDGRARAIRFVNHAMTPGGK